MLYIELPSEEWDSKKEEFVKHPPTKLQLEHSLVSISKWESIFNKPFLHTEMTHDESVEYVKCMTITQNVNPEVYSRLSRDNFMQIDKYIDAPMTATFFSEAEMQKMKGSRSSELVTSELIYYWMISLNIPMECQKWHFNRLMTLIRVCDIKNRPAKKKPMSEVYARNRALNAARKKKYNTHG